jgi:tyrosyl-tRNA synthetase
VSDRIIDELRWRGLVYQVSDEDRIRQRLRAGRATVYAGFDAGSAASLQIGNLVPLLSLRRFQDAGHRPIVLLGGGTSLIGDPGGKTAERPLAPRRRVREQAARVRSQLERFLDFEGDNAAVLVDNIEWLGRLTAMAFLRDVGKHFPVSYMLAKETVRERLAAGISYTEFSYMLLQAYDYLQLSRRFGCLLQIGGSDQWGNITAGCELLRRVDGLAADALTVPLVTTASGAKFGKSEAGAIYLDPALTSPFRFYQFWLGADDRDVAAFLRYFTFLTLEDVTRLEQAAAVAAEKREAQRALARAVTDLVHGPDVRQRVEAASEVLFGGRSVRDADAGALEAALDEVPTVHLNDAVPSVARLLVDAGLAASLSEARRLVAGRGVYTNDDRVDDADAPPPLAAFLGGRVLVLRRGARHRALVVRDRA